MNAHEAATLDRIEDAIDGKLTNRVPLANAVDLLQREYWRRPLADEWDKAMARASREVSVELIERLHREPDNMSGTEQRLADLLSVEARKLRLVCEVAKMVLPSPPPTLGGLTAEHMDAAHEEIADAPRYTHDCELCTFLGQHKEYDLYFCQIGGVPTVIARYSSEGSQYLSGLAFISSIPALKEAARRAVAQGLLSPDEPTRTNDGETVGEVLEPFDVDDQHGVQQRREV